MQNSMVVFFASILGWKHPFWASLVQKMKIVSFTCNLIHYELKYEQLNDDVHSFYFLTILLFMVILFEKIKTVC